MSRLEMVPVAETHREPLRNLMQLYLYDFSVYFCQDDDGYVNDRGLYDFGIDLDRYVRGSDERGHHFWAYLATVERRLAGFALISDRIDQVPAARRQTVTTGRNVDEFFVLRCYRRQGIGREMARLVFDTRPGFWQIAQIAPNLPAQAFWRSVIARYTRGRYEEHTTAEYGEQLVWQTFDSSTW